MFDRLPDPATYSVMAGEDPPSTHFGVPDQKRHGRRSFARRDGRGVRGPACHRGIPVRMCTGTGSPDALGHDVNFNPPVKESGTHV